MMIFMVVVPVSVNVVRKVRKHFMLVLSNQILMMMILQYVIAARIVNVIVQMKSKRKS
jgi:hypothetical protein